MNYSTALRGYTAKRLEEIETADILMGIPSYNNEKTIAHVIQMVTHGLAGHYKDRRSVILIADGGSTDDTREVSRDFEIKPWQEKIVSIYRGPGGKGTALRSVFEAAKRLNVKVCAMVDSDLRSITPDWVKYLLDPILNHDYQYVSPVYVRHKYDGTITNNIVYNLTRALYGKRIRQPIGGDFAISSDVARFYTEQDVWDTDVARFGIDIWMTTIAIARRFNICQAFLGSPKIHNPKDPAADLGPMFTQVVSTLFDLIIDFEFIWKDTFSSRPSNIYGFGLGIEEKPPVVEVNTDTLFESTLNGFKKYAKLWETFIPGPEFSQIKQWEKTDNKKNFSYSSDLWARILFNFAIAYRMNEIDRDKLIESMIPFYHSRVLSFANKTEKANIKEAEEYLENVTRVFEREKYYLVQRWDSSVKRLGSKLFK